MYINGLCQEAVRHENRENKNIEDEVWNIEEPTLLKTWYEDIETGLKITIYKNEIHRNGSNLCHYTPKSIFFTLI